MAWWGKIVGGAFGFLIGGPLGALLGGALGHRFDIGVRDVARRHPYGDVEDRERVQTAFFTATFSVMGHLAKADGRVSEAEIAAANAIMGQMRLSPAQRRAAISLFNEGKRRDFPLDDVLDQLRRECHRRTTLLGMFVEIQLQAALADGRIDVAERRTLRHVAESLGFSPTQFEQLLRMIEGAAHVGGERARAGHVPLSDDYKVLGVTKDASDAEIKKAYRRLMSRHHPDKLVSKGMPEEMVRLANERTQEIRKAYERVVAARREVH